MDFYHLTTASSNVKTGPIAVSTSSSFTCPDSCPFSKGKGCYASYGNLARHWKKVSKGERGGDWGHFLKQVEDLPRGHAFRHNQAGDLPGENEEIDGEKLKSLCAVIKKRKLQAFSYTHKKITSENLKKIRAAIADGFIINVSTENFEQVDKMRKLGLPTVVVLPKGSPEKQVTSGGNRVILCPAQTGKVKNCQQCMICSKDRSITIGFLSHGTGPRLRKSKFHN